jgi:phosphinothricin acetyltransferase
MQDAKAMADIYNYYVENTCITFDYSRLDEVEMHAKLDSLMPRYPVLVLEENHEVLAYAYASLFRVKMAYQWSVETTIYLHPNAVGKGWGRKLYDVLIAMLREQHFVNAYGCVTLPNEASEKLHTSCGFRQVGTFPHAGFKHGTWHSIGWYLMVLNAPTENQQLEPIWFEEFRNSIQCETLLKLNAEW